MNLPVVTSVTAPGAESWIPMLWRDRSKAPPPAPGIRHTDLIADEVFVPTDLRPHELAELLHGHRREVSTVVHQALPYFRSRQCLVDLSIEPRRNLPRRAAGRENARPGADVKSPDARLLCDRRYVRHRQGTLRRGHGQDLQPARPHLRHRHGQRREEEVHPALEQLTQG